MIAKYYDLENFKSHKDLKRNSNLKSLILSFLIFSIIFGYFLTFSHGHYKSELKVPSRNTSKLGTFFNLECITSFDSDLDSLLNGFQSPKNLVKCNEDPVEFSPNGSIIFKEKFNIEICLFATVSFFKNASYNISDYKEIRAGVVLNSRNDFFHFKCKTKFWEYYSFLARVLKMPEENAMDLKINVVMVVLSSLSKEKWISELPKSTKYFTKTMKANILNRFNSINDKPFHSFVPLTTSYLYEEISEDPNYLTKDYSFIWKEFSKGLGYKTLFADDMLENGIESSNIGMRRSPASHYMRPFLNSIKHLTNNKLCVGSIGLGRAMLQYATSFMQAYRNTGFFGLLYLTGYSYESSNANLLDDDLYEFLRIFRQDKNLRDRTVVILMSEQGASIQNYVSESLKERNPFAAIYLPKLFKQKYSYEYMNFLDNVDKLLTPMDIHRTLIDILSLEQRAKLSQKNDVRSLSLFNKIPNSRGCYEAGIKQKWCGCLQKKTTEINSTYNAIAMEFINFLNKEIELIPQAPCLKHELNKVLDFLIFDSEETSTSVLEIRKYYFKIETKKKIVYEFTVQEELSAESGKNPFKFYLNLIKRLTVENPSNNCIESTYQHLKHFCTCKN